MVGVGKNMQRGHCSGMQKRECVSHPQIYWYLYVRHVGDFVTLVGMGSKRKPKKNESPKPRNAEEQPSVPGFLEFARKWAGPVFIIGGFGLIPQDFNFGVTLVYVGFILLIAEIIYDPKIISKPYQVQIVSVCAAFCAAGVFTITVVATQAPIGLYSYALNNGNHADGTNISGIVWDSRFTELRVNISNSEPFDDEDIDLLVHPDKWVYRGSIIDVPLTCELHAAGGDSLSSTRKTKDGPFTTTATRIGSLKDVEINDTEGNDHVTLATEGGYRLRCAKLPANSAVKLVFAVVEIDDKKLDPQATVKPGQFGMTMTGPLPLSFSEFDVFKPRPRPSTVTIKGSYKRQYKNFTLDKTIGVNDGN
jgi:hypothetical protein